MFGGLSEPPTGAVIRAALYSRVSHAPQSLTSVQVSLTPPTGSGGGMGNQTNYGLVPRWSWPRERTFETAHSRSLCRERLVPGNTPATGWWLQSAMINGVDAVDIGDDRRLDRQHRVYVLGPPQELSGTLSTSTGQPTTDYYVVALPRITGLATQLASNGRRAPSTAGRYVFRSPARRLSACSGDRFRDDGFQDRATLEQLAGRAEDRTDRRS